MKGSDLPKRIISEWLKSQILFQEVFLMFAPFYSIFLALAMVGSTLLPAAETDSVELASYTDTSSMISQDSDLAGCPYHTDCPIYPDCTPALDGSGNPWNQDDTSSDTTANQGYRHGHANGNGHHRNR